MTMATLHQFQTTLALVAHPHFAYEVSKEAQHYFLRVSCPQGVCTASGALLAWKGRKWRLSPHMTPGEVVQTALAATLAAVEHEAREGFTYKGVALFGPHMDVDKLAESMVVKERAPRDLQDAHLGCDP